MTVLALLRHAETSWSGAGRLQGRTDIPLSEAGRQTLAHQCIPPIWSHLQVVSSPLVRCTQTAYGLALPDVRIEPRITEMSWGDWEGQTLAVLRTPPGDAMRDNEARGFDFQPPGGESPRAVLARVQPWLAELGSQARDTLAISHRGVIRVVFAQAVGWDMRGKPPAKLDWSCLHLFELDVAGHARVLHLNLPLDATPEPTAIGIGT